MKLEELEKEWEVSSYEEDTADQLDYYINLSNCEINDEAYLYRHGEDTLIEMKIIHIIWWSDNPEYYDGLSGDVLIDGEIKYRADTSAEFILDDDCCLVWFKTV